MDCQYKTVILLKFNVVQTQDLLDKTLLKEAKSAIKTSVKQNTFTLRLEFLEVQSQKKIVSCGNFIASPSYLNTVTLAINQFHFHVSPKSFYFLTPIKSTLRHFKFKIFSIPDGKRRKRRATTLSAESDSLESEDEVVCAEGEVIDDGVCGMYCTYKVNV